MEIKSTTILNSTGIQDSIYESFLTPINKLMESRLKESRLKSRGGTLYVYIHPNCDIEVIEGKKKKKLSEKLSAWTNENVVNELDVQAFVTTLYGAFQKHIVVPDELTSALVCFSLSPMTFDSNTTQDSAQKPKNFVAVQPKFTLDEVVMTDAERHAVMRAITVVKEQDLIYKKWNFASVDKSTKSIICFHGKPGTGKTMCAQAVAHSLGKKILIGSYSQIESELVGVGCKNLKAFFEAAQEQDAVLFIDEADTFLSRRLPSSDSAGSSKHYNSMSNELFQLLEDYNGCVIFASNHITDFDPAVISRIIEPIEFGLPDKAARIKILKKLIPVGLPLQDFGDNEYEKLAESIDGFSGRDIRKAVLICNADAAYKYKVKGGMKDDDIIITSADVIQSFEEVKKAKTKLENAIRGKEIDPKFAQELLDKKRKDTRLVQMMAHAIWADDCIKDKERKAFKEFCSTIGVTVDLDNKSDTPPVKEICSQVKNYAEKIQILNMSGQLLTNDGELNPPEITYISMIYDLLGFPSNKLETYISYLNNTANNFSIWVHLERDFEETMIKSKEVDV